MSDNYTNSDKDTVQIQPVSEKIFTDWLKKQPQITQRWVQSTQFNAELGQVSLLSDAQGELQTVLIGVADADDFWSYGALPQLLPQKNYTIDNKNNFLNHEQYERALLAWGLGCYQFNAYVDREMTESQLFIPKQYNADEITNLASSIYLVRDLINTPADDMGPVELAEAATALANECDAKITVIEGEDLLVEGYPTIYTVGRGSSREPRLIDLTWGDEKAPKVTLVGKGVCFDSGGLDIKTAAGMLLMKKDMGGAAHVLALGRLIMLANLPVRLRILIPAVENSVDARSYHPGDVIETRGGFSVEVGNTDAEGRLVLCDALSEAASEKPEYLIDMATLTGAARVALGPEIAAMFCNNEKFANEMLKTSENVLDPMWRLPLYQPYRDFLKSEIADLSNTGRIPLGGAINAGLFLQYFVNDNIAWMHFDIMAYNNEPKPGRPIGGEAMALRSVYRFLCDKYSEARRPGS